MGTGLVCPRCGAVLEMRQFGAIRLDGCPGCGGVWFDANELNQLSRDPEVTLGEVERAYRESPLVLPAAGPMTCPKCLLPLVPFAFPHTPEVRLDACRQCKGIWLDEGELDALERRLQRHAGGAAVDRQTAPASRSQARAVTAFLISSPCLKCRISNPAGAVICFRCAHKLERHAAHGLCPRCDRKLEMMPSPSPALSLEACRTCGGIWFEEGKLPLFLRLDRQAVSAAQGWTNARETSRFAGNLSGRGNAYCPGCHFPMERKPFGTSGAEIDRCPNCESIWLDGGELLSLHRSLQTGGMPGVGPAMDSWGQGT